MKTFLFFLLVIVLCLHTADSLKCYTCKDIVEQNNSNCLIEKTCSSLDKYCLTAIASVYAPPSAETSNKASSEKTATGASESTTTHMPKATVPTQMDGMQAQTSIDALIQELHQQVSIHGSTVVMQRLRNTAACQPEKLPSTQATPLRSTLSSLLEANIPQGWTNTPHILTKPPLTSMGKTLMVKQCVPMCLPGIQEISTGKTSISCCQTDLCNQRSDRVKISYLALVISVGFLGSLL
ncbi:LOW QUALITY PROTEIN: uncharacterized protein LOC115460469 [Microcaecilia unicolor]|uniref:LOW QUALITY PROTEIN: uncharacterized protein LOC115460469 n=1 Tax=Microcaecilia unicolor TaxID=1415580 RepID=A0A6P7WY53_9AMPH|nr:LOW QUALITY PROTEIN: uncharacterized protein LOC115460469 [Microcaecilia unicolor]